MAAKYVDALVLRAADVTKAVEFYRAIGVPLEEERHDDGPLHYACELGPVHFAIYPAEPGGGHPERLSAGATQVGFQVESVEAAVEAAVGLGARVVVRPDDYPWGRRAVVEDPDGRAVELNKAPAS